MTILPNVSLWPVKTFLGIDYSDSLSHVNSFLKDHTNLYNHRHENPEER